MTTHRRPAGGGRCPEAPAEAHCAPGPREHENCQLTGPTKSPPPAFQPFPFHTNKPAPGIWIKLEMRKTGTEFPALQGDPEVTEKDLSGSKKRPRNSNEAAQVNPHLR